MRENGQGGIFKAPGSINRVSTTFTLATGQHGPNRIFQEIVCFSEEQKQKYVTGNKRDSEGFTSGQREIISERGTEMPVGMVSQD